MGKLCKENTDTAFHYVWLSYMYEDRPDFIEKNIISPFIFFLYFFSFRCTAETELKSKGFKSSSQLARLEDILKDPPRKHALSAPGLTLEKIPALSVVLNPRVDPSGNTYDILKRAANDYEARERNRGFQPGPFEKDGWLLERNKIPIHDYRHKQFEEIKGNDFRFVFVILYSFIARV